MLNITLNTEKNGIELRFNSKPSAEILTKIKENGYHWSNKKKIWYAKQKENTITIANEIAEAIGTFTPAEKSKQEKVKSYDLWALTRTENIENHFEKYHIYDNKEITARIRKHLKERFPMCKWSVTKNGYNSIYVRLLASPFVIDSEALKAIVHYAYIFAQSFNYDNSDSMADYFDVNFYGVYESDIVSSYRYEQLESNMTEHNIEQEFINKKAVFEEEKRNREEKETVEWYNNKCVAIYCDNVLKLVINPEGYNYARYVYFVDKESSIVKEYNSNKGISDDESEKNKSLAKSIEEVSTNIVVTNNWYSTWNTEHFNEYKQLMKGWIYANDFKFSVDVVRAISIPDLKTAMYRLLTEVDGIQEQFSRAGLIENQKITIVRINEFGGMSITRGYFKSYTNTTYAQYDNAVKFVFRPERKRNDYYIHLYRDILIFDGWVEIPENLLWEDVKSNTHGCSIRRTKFLSCDKSQYDVILEYFKNNGIEPLINTYKPIFN